MAADWNTFSPMRATAKAMGVRGNQINASVNIDPTIPIARYRYRKGKRRSMSGKISAAAANIRDGYPNTERVFFFRRGNAGEPSAEGALIKICKEKADNQQTFHQRGMLEIEERQRQKSSGNRRGHDRVPASIESDVQHWADQKGPEARRNHHRRHCSYRRLGYMAGAQHLRHRYHQDATIHTKQRVRQPHRPDRGRRRARNCHGQGVSQ